MPQSSGQVWNLCRIGDELFCLHDRGIFLINGTSVNAWRILPAPGVANLWQDVRTLCMSGYITVFIWLGKRMENGRWLARLRVWTILASFEQEVIRWFGCIIQTTLPVWIWIMIWQKAVRIKEYSAKDGFPVGRDMYIAKIEDRVYLPLPGIYKHNPHKDVMEPCPDMNNLLNGTALFAYLGVSR